MAEDSSFLHEAESALTPATLELPAAGARADRREGWELIDQEAARTLRRTLAGRRLVDFSRPHGFRFSTVGSGRPRSLGEPLAGAQAAVRECRPLVELTV